MDNDSLGRGAGKLGAGVSNSDLGLTQTYVSSLRCDGSFQQGILNRVGVEQVSFLDGSGFYANNIEVNDPLPASPLPAALPLFTAVRSVMRLVGGSPKETRRAPA